MRTPRHVGALNNISDSDDVPRPPALSSSGRKGLRVLFVLIAASVCVATLVGLTALAYGLGHVRVSTETQALPPGLRSLTIHTGDDPVTLRIITDINATAPRIDLRMVTSADDTQLLVARDGPDTRVTLGDSGSGVLRFSRTGEIKVILPPDVGRHLKVAVDQRGGSLSTDADLDQLVAETDAGSVTLAGSARRVDISVRHGDVETSTRIAVAESFRAETDSGRITVEFRAAPRLTEAIADGDVTIGLPGPGPYRVQAQSAPRTGKTTVAVPEATDPSAAEVKARSENGNVMVNQFG
jgi:hypothetical protein